MRINTVFLSIIPMFLLSILNINNVSAQDEDGETSESLSEMPVETTMNSTEASVNITDVIKSLNFSCDINLNCFDKKNQVELVILANKTSSVYPENMCGIRNLHTNGLLLIPHINSSLNYENLKSSGIFSSRGCFLIGSDIIYGTFARDIYSVEQFFGIKNYSTPLGLILTLR